MLFSRNLYPNLLSSNARITRVKVMARKSSIYNEFVYCSFYMLQSVDQLLWHVISQLKSVVSSHDLRIGCNHHANPAFSGKELSKSQEQMMFTSASILYFCSVIANWKLHHCFTPSKNWRSQLAASQNRQSSSSLWFLFHRLPFLQPFMNANISSSNGRISVKICPSCPQHPQCYQQQCCSVQRHPIS